jgi:hypothetical protein
VILLAYLERPQWTWAQVFFIVGMLSALGTAYAASRTHVLTTVGLAVTLFFLGLGLFLAF